jgi:FMN phosphatase YigB (HAD superfamily)
VRHRTAPQEEMIIFLDVDNTLLDNDGLKADLARRIAPVIGDERAARFWEVYEEVRQDQDYVDYPTTIARFDEEDGEHGIRQVLRKLVFDYPFTERLYPHVLETLQALTRVGLPVILSDGDPVYQPWKIQKAKLADAVGGRVMICVHKEAELPEVFAKYPASRYVMVDDKPRIHAALEECCTTEFTTILVKQGKYATDTSVRPRPDYEVDAIGDLRTWTKEKFLHVPQREAAGT